MGRARHNPERRAWRGRSHKKGGARVRDLQEKMEFVGQKCGIRAPVDYTVMYGPDELVPDDEQYHEGDTDPCVMCARPGCMVIVERVKDPK
jgi:hypothetical protein